MTRIIEHRQDAAPGEELFDCGCFNCATATCAPASSAPIWL